MFVLRVGAVHDNHSRFGKHILKPAIFEIRVVMLLLVVAGFGDRLICVFRWRASIGYGSDCGARCFGGGCGRGVVRLARGDRVLRGAGVECYLAGGTLAGYGYCVGGRCGESCWNGAWVVQRSRAGGRLAGALPLSCWL